MNKKKAKLKYKANSFEVLEEGDHVVCAVSKKNISRKFELLERKITGSILFTYRGKSSI